MMNNSRSTNPAQFLNNSLAIRQEIQRFESVHPSIYAIYDLIDLIGHENGLVAQQLRDHVVCIEDSFVNSQEWTLSRSVPDLRLGIVGSLNSGKSALVHRYLTGSYMQEESPEGGRFKKEILVDNHSYLLLIRDEGGPPDVQFTSWVDAVIFVFSLENEASFNAILSYYTKMAHFYRNNSSSSAICGGGVGEIPLILVGTQDAISETNPRLIEDGRARKMAADLKKSCSYYETCATYGLNVERVFQDACQKIVQSRHHQSQQHHHAPSHHHHVTTPLSTPRPVTPQMTSSSSSSLYHTLPHPQQPNQQETKKWNASLVSLTAALSTSTTTTTTSSSGFADLKLSTNSLDNLQQQQPVVTTATLSVVGAGLAVTSSVVATPTCTPTTARKTRRRSNLFTPSKVKNGGGGADFGSGRVIPVKQGYLYKKSSSKGPSLNREWKKKYVTLTDDGRLTYHPSLHDYMDDVHGKEIPLTYVTVKVPGQQKPRGSKSILTVAGGGGGGGSGNTVKTKKFFHDENGGAVAQLIQMTSSNSTNSLLNGGCATTLERAFPTTTTTTTGVGVVKKRHRRVKSSNNHAHNQQQQQQVELTDDSSVTSSLTAAAAAKNDSYEFIVLSLEGKQWQFDACAHDERDEWVAAIEQQILNSLQSNDSSKLSKVNQAGIDRIRHRVPGNDACADCGAPNPDWASINLGLLMCIECSGHHRNLGSHISRVRSLDLDEWPLSHQAVMLAIGNNLANSVWECQITRDRTKPNAQSSTETKGCWIRAKYELKEFLHHHHHQSTTTAVKNDILMTAAPSMAGKSLIMTMTLGQQLIEAVCAADMTAICQILASVNATTCQQHVNGTVGVRDLRTPLHLACAMGNLAIAQLLIWHNADVRAVDQDGRSSLTYARAALNLATARSLKNDIIVNNNNNNTVNVISQCQALIDLLISYDCPELTSVAITGTIPRTRRSSATSTSSTAAAAAAPSSSMV